MITFYKTDETGTHTTEDVERGGWVSVVAPTPEERTWLATEIGIVPEFLSAALDDEERSHTDFDDDTGQALVIVDCPFIEDANEKENPDITQYDTHPLSVLFLPEQDIIMTVTLRENYTVAAAAQGKIRLLDTNHKTELLLKMVLHISKAYIRYLRNIDRQFNENERKLRASLKNDELIKMLGFEKSLVYFSTSLKSMESTLSRISSGRVVKLYEDDRDLLEDVLIEIRQAMEMCSIYTGILNGTMDAFGSVISNRVNETVQILTVVTLLFSIPTIVFSFYGMNTATLPFADLWAYPVIIAAACCLIAIGILTSKRFRR